MSDPSSTILIDHGSHAVLPTIDRLARVAHQGRRSWGLGGSAPPPKKKKYVERVRVCFDPLKMSFFHSKLLLYNCKFHSIKDEQSDTITSLILLNAVDAIYHPNV